VSRIQQETSSIWICSFVRENTFLANLWTTTFVSVTWFTLQNCKLFDITLTSSVNIGLPYDMPCYLIQKNETHNIFPTIMHHIWIWGSLQAINDSLFTRKLGRLSPSLIFIFHEALFSCGPFSISLIFFDYLC
jgi:uncharacterized membrane protein YwzB